MYLYLLKAVDARGSYYKIGHSASPASRFKSIKGAFGGDAEIVSSWMLFSSAKLIEKVMHEMYAESNAHATVGITNGHTEWFFLSPDQVKEVITTCSLIEWYLSSPPELDKDSFSEPVWQLLDLITRGEISKWLAAAVCPVVEDVLDEFE